MSVFKTMLRSRCHRPPPVTDDQEIVLLVLGMRKSGKSYLIQSLTGKEAGPERCAWDADFCTVKCDIYRVECAGVRFALIDTPGMVTDARTVETTLQPIKQFLDNNPLLKIHGVLFTRSGQATRMYGWEVGTYLTIRGICGNPFLSNLTVVLTYFYDEPAALREKDLYKWRQSAFAWFPGSKTRLFEDDDPGSILSHYCAMKRKGILGTKTLLLETELREDCPPAWTTAGKNATLKALRPRGELRTREAWGREVRWKIFGILYRRPR